MKRPLKHLALFLTCTGVSLLFGYCGVVVALDGFAVGGDVDLSEQQKRNGATGDAILEVFEWPSKRVLGVDHSWPFSSAFYGAVLYGAVLGSHRVSKSLRRDTTKASNGQS